MKGYVFVANSTKPTLEEAESRNEVKVSNFSRPCLHAALDLGYDVYLGTNRNRPEELKCELPVHLYDSHTYRSVTAVRDNFIAFRNLMRVLKTGNIEVIHCNTPVGGMIGRICGKLKRVKTVIYSAHGFHFYKGGILNNTILKWAEMIMAHWTDVIITINQEDYEAAKKFYLRKGGKVFLVPGVGVNTEEYRLVQVDRSAVRHSLGLAEDDIICISMGDLIHRKNYATAIKSIALCGNAKLHYLICGKGPELENLQRLAIEQGVEDQIHFLGYRTDIKELAKASDIFLFTSFQEGLPRSLMEAMACGLPCVASKIRGNTDLLEDGIGGFLVDAKDEKVIAEKIEYMSDNFESRNRMGKANLERIKEFDIDIVTQKIRTIYEEVLL